MACSDLSIIARYQARPSRTHVPVTCHASPDHRGAQQGLQWLPQPLLNLARRCSIVLRAAEGKTGSTNGSSVSFHGGDGGGAGGSSGGGDGGGSGGGDGGGSTEEDEGPILSFKEVGSWSRHAGDRFSAMRSFLLMTNCYMEMIKLQTAISMPYLDVIHVLQPLKVEAFMKEKNIKLPADMLEIAKQGGIRLRALEAYVACQVG